MLHIRAKAAEISNNWLAIFGVGADGARQG